MFVQHCEIYRNITVIFNAHQQYKWPICLLLQHCQNTVNFRESCSKLRSVCVLQVPNVFCSLALPYVPMEGCFITKHHLRHESLLFALIFRKFM